MPIERRRIWYCDPVAQNIQNEAIDRVPEMTRHLSQIPKKTKTASNRTKRSAAEITSTRNTTKFERLFTHSAHPMWIFDIATYRFLRVNKAAIEKYGYTEQEFLKMTILDIRPPEDVNTVVKYAETLFDPPSHDMRLPKRSWQHRLKDGRVIWVDVHVQTIKFQGRSAAVGSVYDVTEKKVLKDQKLLEQVYFKTLFNSSNDAIVLLGADGLVMDINSRFERLFGFERNTVLGKRIEDLIVPTHLNHEVQQSWDGIRQNGYIYREAPRLRKDGTFIEVSISGYPIMARSRMIGTYMIYRDVTEKNALLKRIDYQSTHDGVTGLANRHQFQNVVERLLSDIRHGEEHALFNIMIDRLTLINQICGYDAGDHLLKDVAKQISSVVEQGSLAHFGGPEFALLLTNTTPCAAVSLANSIIDKISSMKFRWDDQLMVINVSVGIVSMTRSTGQKRVRDVLAMAETACRVARERGGNRSYVAEQGDQESARLRDEATWISNIHKAIDSGAFSIYGQRVEATHPGRPPKGIELLIRMRGSHGSLISPGAFIPVAERYQLMRQIDRWVITNVLFSDNSPALRHDPKNGLISINLSGETIGDDVACDHIVDLLKESTLPPEYLCFEITETAAVQSTVNANHFIQKVRELGVKIALDDFGSGMSSFRYLRELQVDSVKIDGIFVRNILSSDTDKVMINAICRMVHTLKMDVVAEFVESREMIACLRKLGVDFVQGYAVHKPELWL